MIVDSIWAASPHMRRYEVNQLRGRGAKMRGVVGFVNVSAFRLPTNPHNLVLFFSFRVQRGSYDLAFAYLFASLLYALVGDELSLARWSCCLRSGGGLSDETVTEGG